MGQCELSVVIPCLEEEETIGYCVEKALITIRKGRIDGEVIVADNGSKDNSVKIAESAGARVAQVSEKGYGSALMGGIAEARGRYIIMGDADGSYDFGDIPKFIEKLNQGNDLVMGCRLPTGGGIISPGAMPFLHRWLGNPLLSLLARLMFRVPIHDVYCGLRGFTREHFMGLEQYCTGMEFATEMVIKSSLFGAKIAEIPITLYPDRRKSQGSHLNTFSDGWKTLRFFMLYSPKWLFLIPGLLMIIIGVIGYTIVISRIIIFDITFDAHTLLISSLLFIMGYQTILFAVFAQVYAMNEGLLPEDPMIVKFFKFATLKRGLILSIIMFIFGATNLVQAFSMWYLAGFGPLDYSYMMRYVIPAVTLVVLGFQSFFSFSFVSIMGMGRKPRVRKRL
jgi:glycosyltransferase involved in cell wall biosynthesis